MKRNPLLWLTAQVCLIWLLLAFRPAPPQFGGGDETLLRVKDLGLRKTQPTIFTLDLLPDDYLLFDCEDCGILVERGRITMQLNSPDGAEIIPLTEYLLREGVRVRGQGAYKLLIETKKNFDRISTLVLSVESEKRRLDSERSPETVLDIQQVYIGEERGKNRTHPRFEYNLQTADTLHVQVGGVGESSPEALAISYGVVGQLAGAPITLGQAGTFTIPISQAGTFFVEFSADNRRFYDFTKDFYNLSIRRIPEAEEEYVSFGGGGAGTTPEGAEEEKEDPMAALLKELIEMQLEEPKEGLQPLNRISPPNFSVAPKANLAGSNCTCGQIPLPKADIMVYWLGVSAKGKQAIKQIERAHLDQDRLSPGLFPSYAKSILIDKNPKSYLFNAANLDVTFYEDVEWAIVPRQGKEAFEAGQTPTSALKIGGRVKTDFGYILGVPEGEYYLCFRNDNPRSSVQVAIDFQLFNQALITN